MQYELCVVQFMHPGGEHHPTKGEIPWNRGKHQRKFLKVPGRYVTSGGQNSGEIVFWGEWEPESRVIRRLPNGEDGLPRHLYEPYYVPRASYACVQNTDPFVFGDQFHFTLCQQTTSKGPTQLRYLSDGSVILFGSQMHRYFYLDTVFVVARGIDHTRYDYQETVLPHVSEAYKETTLYPIHQHEGCPCSSPRKELKWQSSLRLYFGATYDLPTEGMFSFFPCLPYGEGAGGFARPKIEIEGLITDNLTQGRKLTERPDIGCIQTLWKHVATQVQKQGLLLGTSANLPPRRVS